ncbi:MAG TPA: GNAT family N-acetyltransferase [Dehalococcoidia bacterium]|nr:GNAT family N-acetyltransferase [Dehalococcoidia bacterium]
MAFSPIDTPRLRVRTFVPEDCPAVYAYRSDAAVSHYLGVGVHTEEQTREFVTRNAGEEARALALVLRAEDRLIGHLVFHPWFAPRTYEIGWALHPAYQGRGYAAEGARALLRYSFETLKLHRVIATCQPENTASYRVMEKIGLRQEGLFRQCLARPDGTWWDECFFALLEEEWRSTEAPANPRPERRGWRA